MKFAPTASSILTSLFGRKKLYLPVSIRRIRSGSVRDPFGIRGGTARTRTKREPPLTTKREPYAVALGKKSLLGHFCAPAVLGIGA